jgi:hypothetical protein
MQGTKRTVIDLKFLKNFCLRRFNQFAYTPSVGASGGLLIACTGQIFTGTVIETHGFAATVKLIPFQSSQEWFVTNVYGPCEAVAKAKFTTWMHQPMIYGWWWETLIS